MCNFNQSWVGKCKKANVEGHEYCEEHLNVKCSVCGEQATHDCGETMQLVCGSPLCDSIECKLQHFYRSHGYAFLDVMSMEEMLQIKPFMIVISKVYYGEGKFADFLNKKYADRLEVLLLTFGKDGNIKFHKANYNYYCKVKEEIPKLFEYSFYEDEIEQKGLYFYDGIVNINENYNNDIIDKLEKIPFTKEK